MKIGSARSTGQVLYEDQVVQAVCAALEGAGWNIVSRAFAHQHGDDIVAERGAERLVVEAKGAGSSKKGTRRFGLEFNRGQVRSHVGVAVLRALAVASRGTSLAAIALPDNTQHRDIAGSAATALSRAGIGIFWVAEDGSVTADLPCVTV